jgi:RecT family
MKNQGVVATIPDGDRDWDRLKEEATYALKSGILPAAINTPEKAIAIALMGKELGLPVMASLTGLFVVNGKVQLSGALMLRLIYERVPGAIVTVLSSPDKALTECVVEMSRPGQKPMQFRYTLDEAKRAGFLSKQPWQNHPATMLRWSAIRTGARIVFADALAGCYMEDEMQQPAKHLDAAITEPVSVEAPPLAAAFVDARPAAPIEGMSALGQVLGASTPKEIVRAAGIDPNTVIPGGAHRGTKLSDKPKEEWAKYAIATMAKLNNPEFPQALRGDAENILAIVQAYLGEE